MAMNLTPKQLKILTRIRDLRLTQGYSPTMQELAEELGVSKVTVFEHVEALIKKGALLRKPNKARSLEVSPDIELPDETRHTSLPLVGTIAAGLPIVATEVEGLREVDRAPIRVVPRDGAGLAEAVAALIAAPRPAPVPLEALADWRGSSVNAQLEAIYARLLSGSSGGRR